MPEVVLVYPRTRWDIANLTTRLPLSVLYVATELKKAGISVQIVDQRVDDAWEKTLRDALASRPRWVGISSMTGQQIRWGLDAAKIVREAAPGAPILWGGVHASILPEQTLAHELVDLVALGDGEDLAIDLTRALASGADLATVAGLGWKKDGRAVLNEARAAMAMDDLSPLDYSLVPVERYVLNDVPGERSLQITTSRGCPWRCSYCYIVTVPNGRRYRSESPERTVDHIERLMREFNLHAIHINDDEFFTRLDRSKAVCRGILDRGLKLTLRANCRIDYIDRFSMEDLALFREAGFKHLYLGAESGSDRILQMVEKDITKAQILRVNLKLRAAGIAPKFSFMAGFPTETLEEVKETMRLMERLVRENPDAYTTPIQLYCPYPGTPLMKQCEASGMKVPDTLEGWIDTGFEHVDYHWLSQPEERLLQDAAYFTFFLDGKTMPDAVGFAPLRWATRAYGRLVRERVRADFFAFMPEVRVIKWALAHAG